MQGKERIKTKKTGFYRKAKRGGGGERSRVRFLPGVIAAGATLVIFITITSYLIIQSVVPLSRAPQLGKLCFALASLIGCWTAARSSNTCKLPAAAISGLFLLAVTAACFAMRKDSGSVKFAAPFAITIGTILFGAVLGTRRRGRGYR